jgi:hypothetical protein
MSQLSTLSDVRAAGDGPVPRWGRRAGLAVLAVVVVAGAFGLFGVHSRTVTRHGGGYTLSVTYPQTARAGLDVPWRAIANHAGGFPKGLTLAVSTDYFRMFETQGFYPNPDSQTNDGTYVYFSYDQASSDQFVLDYDAYIQPASQIGKKAVVELIVNGDVVAKVSLRTWLVP